MKRSTFFLGFAFMILFSSHSFAEKLNLTHHCADLSPKPDKVIFEINRGLDNEQGSIRDVSVYFFWKDLRNSSEPILRQSLTDLIYRLVGTKLSIASFSKDLDINISNMSEFGFGPEKQNVYSKLYIQSPAETLKYLNDDYETLQAMTAEFWNTLVAKIQPLAL